MTYEESLVIREGIWARTLERLQELARLSQAWPCGENFPAYGPGPCMNPGEAHEEADELLLELLDDRNMAETFRAITRWYS